MEYDIPMKPYGPTAGRDHIEDKPRPKTKTVDFHIHMRIQDADKLIGDRIPDDSKVQYRFASKASKEQTLKHHSERMPYLTDMNYRLPDMEKMQVDTKLISGYRIVDNNLVNLVATLAGPFLMYIFIHLAT